ncbi:lauroyl/myristoyl acyltransferase [Candidatus Scalindua japonica]|uniref:Lauroyl/myristoyl acyltransferase n=1 Tax=Candidatus Scalindua japonica TaxID=1284222 RepID=A0A286TZB8_9BACT|nr:hypothetical protein [Candidatus Scalindua japonica]GAX61243.1 lauroyl/myristoyl acyltransferase [Candidatus Scalindua japonica]
MEAIKQIVRTPKNHEIRIKIPDHVPENDPVEIIIFFRNKTEDYNNKINELKNATQDKFFLSDLKEVSEDLKYVDLEEWQ